MLHSKKIPNNLNQGRDIIFVDAKNIVFPLTVRKWSAGDFFYPLNMNNQKKKVQDYLTDNKVDRFDKQNVFILLNADGNIVWIIGFRQDNRFKIQPNSEQIIIFEHKII
jgi:tRNA(Ile)-lysidine synthase